HTEYRGFTTQYTPPGSSVAYTVLQLTSTYYNPTIQGTSNSGQNTLTLNSTAGLATGMFVTGPGNSATSETPITVNGSTVALSTPAAPGSATAQFTFPYQNPSPAKKGPPIATGQTAPISEPLFSSNTIGLGAWPPMPSWMGNGTETPGQMVFGCDGAFA